MNNQMKFGPFFDAQTEGGGASEADNLVNPDESSEAGNLSESHEKPGVEPGKKVRTWKDAFEQENDKLFKKKELFTPDMVEAERKAAVEKYVAESEAIKPPVVDTEKTDKEVEKLRKKISDYEKVIEDKTKNEAKSVVKNLIKGTFNNLVTDIDDVVKLLEDKIEFKNGECVVVNKDDVSVKKLFEKFAEKKHHFKVQDSEKEGNELRKKNKTGGSGMTLDDRRQRLGI